MEIRWPVFLSSYDQSNNIASLAEAMMRQYLQPYSFNINFTLINEGNLPMGQLFLNTKLCLFSSVPLSLLNKLKSEEGMLFNETG